jgi:hypothetical protein
VRDGGEGERRWNGAGRPIVPSLVVEGRTLPILHVTQLAAALGLPGPEARSTAGLAWECSTILDAWLGHLRGLDLRLLTRPTPSRGRSCRNLTVNVFHPFELLPETWSTGRFDWDPDGDAGREAVLGDAEAVVRFAERAAAGWAAFLIAAGDELARDDPLVSSPRGEVTYSELLASQRWHASYHYRQLVDFLRSQGTAPTAVLPLERLRDLELPPDIY